MSGNFDWYGDNADNSIAIRSVSAVAVYVNPDGDIVIRQEDPTGPDDHVVVVPVSFIPSLTAAIDKAVAASLADEGK